MLVGKHAAFLFAQLTDKLIKLCLAFLRAGYITFKHPVLSTRFCSLESGHSKPTAILSLVRSAAAKMIRSKISTFCHTP
jgi:hypothetical protein